ncbi:MAG: restriction endonuclease subunit S, partial [Bacteroidales bacterium]|nr:restriction endonuclease subunit S [Bacteroidales bacterium]
MKQNIISRDEAPSRAQRVLSKWDIIYQCVRPYQLNNYIIRDDSTIQRVASTGYAQIRTKHNPDFIYQLLHTKGFTDQVINRCTGTNYPAINSSDLSGIEIHFPSIQEQAQIGELLTLIDQRISIQSKVIEDLKKLKTAIEERIIKLVQGKQISLGDILEERNE